MVWIFQLSTLLLEQKHIVLDGVSKTIAEIEMTNDNIPLKAVTFFIWSICHIYRQQTYANRVE